ncbi:unnamed protein product [Polarella glacialis]|uniref:Pentacotripeptide-repeat region of PRORP domain-containing protein n=1 Tax=Polarella glacialis TaxID=89957 RepID=A0A813H6C6_POLGL|nr:unnamed protein product [Polarella glacialis]
MSLALLTLGASPRESSQLQRGLRNEEARNGAARAGLRPPSRSSPQQPPEQRRLGPKFRDAKGFTSAISAAGKASEWREAIELYSIMQKESVPVDAFAYGAIMRACIRPARRWAVALQIFREMAVAGVLPDGVVCKFALDACEQGGQWQTSLNILSDMHGADLQPDKFTFSGLMSVCAAAHQWLVAVTLLKQMRDRSVAGDVVVYAGCMRACGAGGQWELAASLLQEMSLQGIEPNHVAWNTAIWACGQEKQWQMALRLLAECEEVLGSIDVKVPQLHVSSLPASIPYPRLLNNSSDSRTATNQQKTT